MAAPNTPNNNQKRNSVKPTDDSLSLKYILGILFGNKLLIAGCVLVALVLAFLYLQRTPPTYSRYSTVLVKEKRMGSRNFRDQLADLGLASAGSTVENEMQEFKSPYLMYMVIKKLNLYTMYSEKKMLRTSDLYGKSPLKVTFPEATDDDRVSLQIKVTGDNGYEIREMQYFDTIVEMPVKIDTVIPVKAYQCVSTPAGKIIVEPAPKAGIKDSGRIIRVTRLHPNDLADAFAGSLNISLANKDATVFNMVFNDECPKRAEDILGNLVDTYNQLIQEETLLQAEATTKFIDGRLDLLEKELGNIDNSIENYKSLELVTNVGMEGISNVNEQKQYSSRALDAANQVEIAKYINECLNDSTLEGQLLPSNVGINNATLNGLIENYNQMLIKRGRLVANSSTKNPLVKEMDETLKQLRASISSSLANVIHTNSLVANSLKKKEAQINSRIARNPKQEKYLQMIGRQQKIKEALYLFLLQKREENELSGRMEISNLRVITPPRGSKSPIAPQKAKVVLMALVLGVGLPTFAIWLLLTLDGTVRSKKDIEGLTIPYLGPVPLAAAIKDKKVQPVRLMVADKQRDVVNEAFRVLRSNFIFMAGKETEFVLFTSFFPNSGKTFVSCNLALSMALMGKKILLVDMDMRKAELSKGLCDKRYGVSSLLNGTSESLEDCIFQSEAHENIDILPVGVMPPNPAELLLGERMEQLMAQLKGRYDYVFIDSTPLNLVADASIVGKYADLVLFVMREGQFHIDALPDLEELYQSGVFKRMATILNGSVGGSTYGVRRYGAYGYGHYGHYGQYGSYAYAAYGEHKKS